MISWYCIHCHLSWEILVNVMFTAPIMKPIKWQQHLLVSCSMRVWKCIWFKQKIYSILISFEVSNDKMSLAFHYRLVFWDNNEIISVSSEVTELMIVTFLMIFLIIMSSKCLIITIANNIFKLQKWLSVCNWDLNVIYLLLFLGLKCHSLNNIICFISQHLCWVKWLSTTHY